MLKIKDNVDLKELEKYGFEYHWREDAYYDFAYNNELDLEITFADRNLLFDEISKIKKYEELLYDLIKDNLVEKVEELEKGSEE